MAGLWDNIVGAVAGSMNTVKSVGGISSADNPVAVVKAIGNTMKHTSRTVENADHAVHGDAREQKADAVAQNIAENFSAASGLKAEIPKYERDAGKSTIVIDTDASGRTVDDVRKLIEASMHDNRGRPIDKNFEIKENGDKLEITFSDNRASQVGNALLSVADDVKETVVMASASGKQPETHQPAHLEASRTNNGIITNNINEMPPQFPAGYEPGGVLRQLRDGQEPQIKPNAASMSSEHLSSDVPSSQKLSPQVIEESERQREEGRAREIPLNTQPVRTNPEHAKQGRELLDGLAGSSASEPSPQPHAAPSNQILEFDLKKGADGRGEYYHNHDEVLRAAQERAEEGPSRLDTIRNELLKGQPEPARPSGASTKPDFAAMLADAGVKPEALSLGLIAHHVEGNHQVAPQTVTNVASRNEPAGHSFS